MEGVRLNNRAAVTANAQTNPFVALLDGIGRSLAEIGQSLVLFAHLLGALTKVTLGTLAHPARPLLDEQEKLPFGEDTEIAA